MKKSLKLKVLATIVLLSCLSGWCQNNTAILSTGEQDSDSVLVAYNDLRVANAKMIELKYIKDINNKLRIVVANDSIIQETQSKMLSTANNKVKRYKSQRNILGGTTIISILAAILIGLL